MYSLAIDEGPTDGKMSARLSRKNRVICSGLGRRHVIHCGEMEESPLEPGDRAEVCIAEPGRVGHDRVEDWLDVRRRAGDDAEDLTRCRLLFEGLLRLLEPPRIRDGDHAL